MKKIKIIGIIAAAAVSITAATAITASAAGGHAGTQKQNFSQSMNWKAGNPLASTRLQGVLDKLVTAGTISKAQETAITNALTAGKERTGIRAALDSLVTAGTITKDQQTAILNAIKSSMPVRPDFGGKGGFGFGLGKLVEAGTITKDQAAAIRTAIFDAMKAAQGKIDMNTILDKLVTAGTITAEQKAAILNAVIPKPDGNGPGNGCPHRGENIGRGKPAPTENKL